MANETDMEKIDVLSLPYANRQLVMVQPDAVVAATRKMEIEARKKDSLPDWNSMATSIVKKLFSPHGDDSSGG